MRINIGYFIKFIKKILGIKSHSKFKDFIYVEKPCAISCNGEFMIDDYPYASCDVYRKFKNKEDEENE